MTSSAARVSDASSIDTLEPMAFAKGSSLRRSIGLLVAPSVLNPRVHGEYPCWNLTATGPSSSSNDLSALVSGTFLPVVLSMDSVTEEGTLFHLQRPYFTYSSGRPLSFAYPSRYSSHFG